MARETIWRCDGCQQISTDNDLEEFLHRPVTATTQNYQRSVQLCALCREGHTAADIVRMSANVTQ